MERKEYRSLELILLVCGFINAICSYKDRMNCISSGKQPDKPRIPTMPSLRIHNTNSFGKNTSSITKSVVMIKRKAVGLLVVYLEVTNQMLCQDRLMIVVHIR